MSLTPSVLLKPPAPAPHGREPPGAPPDTPFAAVLDDHQARTAVAEGQQRGDTPPAPVVERGAHEPARHGGDRDHERAPDPKQDGRSTGALAALLGGLPLPAAVVSVVGARLPAAPASQEPGAPVLPAAAQAKALPLLAAIPTGPTVPAAASALPLAPGANPGAELAPPNAAAPAAAAATTAPEQAAPAAPALPSALTAVARALHAPAASGAPAAATATPTSPDPATAAGAAARAAPGAPVSGRAATQAAEPSVAPGSVSAAGPTPAPAAQASDPAGSAESAPGVGLEHAVETVRLALRAAADGGVTRARISLTPRELGSIEVHLRQTADGLVARVVAQHAVAAQLLQQHGGELRRQLEQSGVNVLRLDIGASGDQGGQAAGRQALADGGAAAGRGCAAADDASTPLDGASETTATATLALPNGALVDVLA